ncbi:MAG: hypothetical protein IT379_41800, partial [Deltaproteobacteria bacterium]|nr:hypothetical protein [Deltaproteobacteria bacterium]
MLGGYARAFLVTSVAWLLVACGDDDGRTQPTADARPPDSEPPADGGDLDGGDAGRRPNDPVVDPLIEPLERLRAASRDPVAITLERGF